MIEAQHTGKMLGVWGYSETADAGRYQSRKRRRANAEVRGRMRRATERASSPSDNEVGESGDSRDKGGVVPFYELRAEKRPIRQEVVAWGARYPSSTRTGAIPIVGPIRYPTGPKENGQGIRKICSGEDDNSGGAGCGGLPPGLLSQPPMAHCRKKPSKRQQRYKARQSPGGPTKRSEELGNA